jgi:hypothetical protein
MHLAHAIGGDRDAMLVGLHLTRDTNVEHCHAALILA